MAILNNLIVNGSSRFLNTIYCQDIQVSGTATLSSLSLSGNLSVTGTSTLTGHVSIGGYNNTSYGLSTNSAIVNSWIRTTGQTGWYNESYGGGWYMTDGNYVRSYGKPVMMGHNLYFGNTNRYINTSGDAVLNSISNATNITTNNLSVANNLHAAHFDLQTVAQLGGSFYVSPTVKFSNSGTTLVVAKSGTTLTLTITDSSITSTTMAGIVWSANSRVKVSGTINGVVTGTMDGTVSSINTGSHTLTLSVSGENSGSVVAGTYSASQFSDLSVMVYQRRDGSNDYRVGIWMNCYDLVNSSSTIRIYGGSSASPNVMLGNLSNAGLGTVNNLTPEGWGLFAQNAFLHGKVVANGGLIGNWTIGTAGMYYTSDAPGSTSITMIPGGTTASTTSIGGSSGSKQWVFTVKNLFGVDTSGALYSSSGKIGGWSIGTSSLYNTTNSMTSTGVGLYLGTDGIRNYSSGTQYVNITSGKITALGVDVSGKITATSGAIGGFDITSTAIKTKDVAVTSNADNSISLSSADFTRTINSTSRAGLRFAIGDKFGVTGDGIIYASSVDLTGRITATSGTIGGCSITDGVLYITDANVSGTISASHINTSSITIAQSQVDGLTTALNGKASTSSVTDAAKTATNFITADGTNGIKIHNTSNTTDYVQIISDGTHIYKGSNDVAFFGDTARIGRIANGIVRTQIDSDSFDVIKRANNADTTLATFGETATIGNMSARGVSIDANGFKFNNGGEQNFFIGVDSRSGDTITSATATVTKSSTTKTIDDIVYYRVASISSGRTVISVVGYFVSATENGEELMFAAVENNVDSWVVDSGYLWVEDGYSTYSSFEESITYTYVASNTSNLPYMVLGISAYDNNNIPGIISFVQGYKNKATGSFSTALGSSTVASGKGAFSCGSGTTASGDWSFACGMNASSSGKYSYTEGYRTNAYGKGGHAEGGETQSYGEYSHSEGCKTIAYGGGHAEGLGSVADAYCHAEGMHTAASGSGSHSEGYYTVASGNCSHSQGRWSVATGVCSFASGIRTVALNDYNTVIGRYNEATVSGSGTEESPYTYSNVGDYPFIIGNGQIMGAGTVDATSLRSNAFTVDWSGNVFAAGNVMAANTSHIGMIIMSTTLDTMAKVIAIYGGTTWIQHSGYMLRGATSGVTANSATSNGGAETVTLTVDQIPSHTHPNPSDGAFLINKSVTSGYAMAFASGSYNRTSASATGSRGGGQAHENMPPYKNVYIWERTA